METVYTNTHIFALMKWLYSHIDHMVECLPKSNHRSFNSPGQFVRPMFIWGIFLGSIHCSDTLIDAIWRDLDLDDVINVRRNANCYNTFYYSLLKFKMNQYQYPTCINKHIMPYRVQVIIFENICLPDNKKTWKYSVLET